MTDQYELPQLGSVRLEHRLIDYDGPILFSVLTSADVRYVAFFVDESGEQWTYWYSAVSPQRFQNLIRGELPVRDIFEFPEEPRVLEVFWDHASSTYHGDFKAPMDLDLDALPDASVRLELLPAQVVNLALGGQSESPTLTSTASASRASRRLVTRMLFNPHSAQHSAPAAAVASAIGRFQEVIDAIAYALGGDPKEKGPIPNATTEQTLFLLRPVFTSSLGIELLAERESDFWNDSLVAESVQRLFDLFNVGSDRESLRRLSSSLKKRAVNKYRDFLDDLASVDSDVVIEAATPKDDEGQRVVLPRTKIREILLALYTTEIAEPDLLQFNAELIGVNKRTRRFEVRRISDSQRFTGLISGLALPVARQARLDAIYSVQLVRATEYDSMVDLERERFELIELSPLTKLVSEKPKEAQ